MKLITILMTAGLMCSAFGQDNSTQKTLNSQKRKDAKPVPASPAIPPDATQLPDGSFRYVDKDGKKWIYRNTPFGISKAEERPPVPAQKPEEDPVRTEDLGDSVRFTRPTPFGNKVWTVKKSDLDGYDKQMWERDQQKAASKTAPSKPGDAGKNGASKNDPGKHEAGKVDKGRQDGAR